MNSQLKPRRMTAVVITVVLSVLSTLTVAAPASAAALVNPTTVSCSWNDSGCKKAKAWYQRYWDYGMTVQYSSAGTLVARDGLRRMAAIAVGGALEGKSSYLLSNIDTELGRLYKTSSKMACAKKALYNTANQIRKEEANIANMEETLTVIKKVAKSNQILKAYAQIGVDALDTVDAIAQTQHAKLLYGDLMNC